jgi:predicted GNAT family acetyltransferase
MPDVRHEPDQSRFAADVDGGTAELEYRRKDNVIAFIHTFVPKAARGQHLGDALVEAGLAFAREHDLAVIPQCPFVRHYVETHPEAQDLVRG